LTRRQFEKPCARISFFLPVPYLPNLTFPIAHSSFQDPLALQDDEL